MNELNKIKQRLAYLEQRQAEADKQGIEWLASANQRFARFRAFAERKPENPTNHSHANKHDALLAIAH